MKIGVLFNCQNQGIAEALRALLPDADIVNYGAAIGLPAHIEEERAAILSGCDHLISAHFSRKHGRLSEHDLRQTARRLHLLPEFVFGGYHPDTCYVHIDGRELPSAIGGYQSRIALVGFLAGLSPRETAALYNRLAFARLGYFAAFAEQSAMLIAYWAKHGLDARPLLKTWSEQRCFAHTVNHPKMIVLLDLARIACERMAITPDNPGIDPAALPDILATGPSSPLFADIAASIGIEPEGCFSGGGSGANRIVFTPDEFVSRSFDHFADAPPAALMAAPGVADAVAALGFTQRRTASRRKPGPGMALMTAHGTLLREGPEAGRLSHQPLLVPPAQAPYARADCAPVHPARTTAALASADLVTYARPNCVALWRQNAFLCAERDSGAALFNRPAAGEWESFLPLLDADIHTLVRLLGADWFLGDTGETIPRALIRLTTGPTLQFGRWSIDLVRHFPQPGPTPGTLTLLLDGEPCTLREIVHPPSDPAPRTTLPEPGQRLVIVGAPAWLPPPLTARDADRAWVYRRATVPEALNGRVQPADAVLRRSPTDTAAPPSPLAMRFFTPRTPGRLGWMEAAIRLHVLAAIAPAGAVFQHPPDLSPEILQAWHALGFQYLAYSPTDGPTTGQSTPDLLWLEPDRAAQLPAEALAGLRARIGTPPASARKLYWRQGIAPAAQIALAANGFEPVDALPIVAQIALASQAAWVVARSGHCPIVFCQPGTRLIELSADAAFTVDDWMMAAKLGVLHGVLPCASEGEDLAPDMDRFVALVAMLAARVTGEAGWNGAWADWRIRR